MPPFLYLSDEMFKCVGYVMLARCVPPGCLEPGFGEHGYLSEYVACLTLWVGKRSGHKSRGE